MLTEILSTIAVASTLIVATFTIANHLKKISEDYNNLKIAMQEEMDQINKTKVSRDELREYFVLALQPLKVTVDNLKETVCDLKELLNRITVIHVRPDGK
jgi:hypothetical protein